MHLDQNRTPLFDAVKRHVRRAAVPLQIPGHKHGNALAEFKEFVGENVMRMDLNETRGIDLLWDPPGVIAEAERLLAAAFGARQAFFLINGTTSGVQAMIMSACRPGESIVVPRNAHKSIYNGLILSGARPVYVQPEVNDELGIVLNVRPEALAETVAGNPQAKAVMTINPSYYGVAPDMEALAGIAHARGLAVLADEAHGTHLYFHDAFPPGGIAAGADISAASLHKTGGSLTQSSALLVGEGSVDPCYVRQVLALTYTSSPSYILLCSLDAARKQLATRGPQILESVLEMVRRAREEINRTKGLFAPGKDFFAAAGGFGFDETKLLVNVQGLGLTGYEVEALLAADYNILIELADMYNILAVISLGERWEYLSAFVDALKDIAARARPGGGRKLPQLPRLSFEPEVVLPPREAFYSPKRKVPLADCAGKIAGEMIMSYPPGIPLVCPGEVITPEIVDCVEVLKRQKCTLQGTADPTVDSVLILDC